MGLLDALGSLTMAAGEELPGITQRVEGRAVKKVNAAIGADFEAARIADDVEEMKRVMSNAKTGTYDIGSTAPSADVFNVMSQGITGYQNDDYTKTVERLKATIAANPYDIKAKVKLAQYTAEASGPKWTSAEVTAATEDVTAQIDNQRRIDAAGVRGAEVGVEFQESQVAKAEKDAQKVDIENAARTQMYALTEGGKNSEAAKIASSLGMTAYAKMLRGEGKFGTGKEMFDAERELSKEFKDQTKEYVKVRDAYARLLTVNVQPSAAGDLATIFAFMKMLDPGSTVREGEFANAETSTSAHQLMWNKYNKLLTGARLGKIYKPDAELTRAELKEKQAAVSQRDDFLDTARQLYMAQRAGRDKTISGMMPMVGPEGYNLNSKNIFIDDESDIIFNELALKGELGPEQLAKFEKLQKDGKLGPTGGPKHGAKTWEELMNQPIGGVDPWADEQTDGGAGGDGAGASNGQGGDVGQAGIPAGHTIETLPSGKKVLIDAEGNPVREVTP